MGDEYTEIKKKTVTKHFSKMPLSTEITQQQIHATKRKKIF